MKKILIVFVFILLVAFIYQFLGPYAQRDRMGVPDFNQYLPKSIDGWAVEDKSIADSPEMLRVVEGVLRYDNALYRIYKKNGVQISVYLAYWLPGKVHREAVDTHTPDICWVANGWTMKRREGLGRIKTLAGEVSIPNHRSFNANGSNVSVLYWHIEGTNILASHSIEDSRQSFAERTRQRLRQVVTSIYTKPESQLFVRVSSNGEIAGQLSLAPVEAVLEFVAKNTLN